MNALLPADNVLAITGILFIVVWGALYLEGRFAWARTVSAALLALLGGLVLSNAGILPFTSPAYDFVNDHFILVAIPLLLFKADLRVILRQGGRVLAGFMVSATGVVAGAGIAFALIEVPESARYAGMLVGGYTGGSLNFVAVSQAVGMDDPALGTAALAAESLAGISYLFVLAVLPTVAAVRRWLPLRGPEAGAAGGPAEGGAGADAFGGRSGADSSDGGGRADSSDGQGPGPDWIAHVAVALGMSLVVCAAGLWLAAAVGRPRYAVLAITVLAVALANLAPARFARLKGDQQLGMLLLYVFFVVYAAGADIRSLFGAAALMLSYAFVVILVQAVVSAVGARVFRFSYAEMLIASNACVLGPPTAAALAAGRGWNGLVTPGILTGVFGYVVGNFLGVGVFVWLQ